MAVADVFLACDQAVANNVPLRPPDPGRSGSPFQNWFEDSLRHAGIRSRGFGANAWPDFALEDFDEGYELKGLEVPGRWNDFDANSRLPKGTHDGREIYYVFGRYPKGADRKGLPLSDFVICIGSFLSREGYPIHKNTSVRGAGSYGDVLIRVRKMFVPPTPFRSVQGTIGQRTLIVTDSTASKLDSDERIERVGELERVEATEHVQSIMIDLGVPGLQVKTVPNTASGGRVHHFVAFRRAGLVGPAVEMTARTDSLTIDIANELAESDG